MDENIKSKFERIREIILVLLLAIWMIIPVLKDLKMTWFKATIYEYTFIKIVGAVGLFFLIFDIYINSKKVENKKQYDKEILPITMLGIFMICTFISCLFSPNIDNALLGTEYRKDGYITYLSYAGFFACAYLIKSKSNKKLLINIFIVIAILNIIIAELSSRGIFLEVFAKRRILNTCFFSFNHYGYYLLLATVSSNFLFITQKNKAMKILYLLAYIFMMYYLILNNTFGCYLSLVATLIFFMIYCIYNKKNIVLSIVSIIIFIVMSFANSEIRTITQNNISRLFEDIKNIVVAEHVKNKETVTKEEEELKAEAIKLAEQAGTSRMSLWKNGINFFIERPILGYGPENLEVKYAEVGIYQDRPHNLLIQLATTSGIIGLLTYITAIGIILVRGLKTIKMENDIHIVVFANIIAYLISAMFGNSMYYTSPYFFIFLGFLMYENINAMKEK